jgi:hypothetical protein
MKTPTTTPPQSAADKLERIDALCAGILRDSQQRDHLDTGDAINTFNMIRSIIAGRI